MAAKKPAIPIDALIRDHIELPAHRRKLNREAQKHAISDDGTTPLHDDKALTVVEVGLDHLDRQRAKARKPRPSGDDGRTTREVVADVVKQHPSETPPGKLLPHIHAAIEANGNKPIKDKRAKELIRQVRRAGPR